MTQPSSQPAPRCVCGDAKNQHMADSPYACWNPACQCPKFQAAPDAEVVAAVAHLELLSKHLMQQGSQGQREDSAAIAILLADRARAQACIVALEKGITETIAACERQDFRIFEQITVADVLKPLLPQKVPDGKA